MAYASVENLYSIYGKEHIDRLLPNQEDGEVDTKPFEIALSNASSEIDMMLAVRYETPVAKPPAILVEWTCTIAFYKRSQDYGVGGLTDEIRKRYEDILTALKLLVKGQSNIPDFVEKDGSKETVEDKVYIESNVDKTGINRLFTRRKMTGL